MIELAVNPRQLLAVQQGAKSYLSFPANACAAQKETACQPGAAGARLFRRILL